MTACRLCTGAGAADGLVTTVSSLCAAGDVIHLFHVVPTVAGASDGTPGDPGLAALADVPVAVTRNDPAQDAANVRAPVSLQMLSLAVPVRKLAALVI